MIVTMSRLCAHDVVINEFVANPYGTVEGSRWIELYNPTAGEINLQGWQIQVAGSEFGTIMTFSRIYIQPNEFMLIGEEYVPGADLYRDLPLPMSQSSTNALRLISPTGYTDTVLYHQPNVNKLPCDCSEVGSSFTVMPAAGYSLARISDGYDTDISADDWFASSRPTPGYSNRFLIDLQIVELEASVSNSDVFYLVNIVNPSQYVIPSGAASLRTFLNGICQGYIALPELLPEYSMTHSHTISSLEGNYYVLEVRLVYADDSDWDNNIQSASFVIDRSPLVINEVLFKQTTDNTEWIEIFNRGEQPVKMSGFSFIDAAETVTRFDGLINPGAYMVITRFKDRFLDFNSYVHPDLVIESSSWAILNNDRETILLVDGLGTELDFVEYTAPASYPSDLSLERINPFEDNSAWERSSHPKLSTPAFANSHLPKQYDLVLSSSTLLHAGNYLEHHLDVNNIGYNPINSFEICCYSFREAEDTGTIIFHDQFSIDDSLSIVFETALPEGKYTTFQYLIQASEDEDISNNEGFNFLNNNAKPVVINEIMFRTHSGQPKWIELKINERYKFLKDVTLITERYVIPVTISSSDFVIITGNDNDAEQIRHQYNLYDVPFFTGLANLYVAGEELTLTDPSGNILEHLTYNPDWSKERGVSIERVNPELPETADNWGHSVSAPGCTPGHENSIYTPFIPVSSSINIAPNPFSPFRHEKTIISYEFPERMNMVTCRIFDLKGRLINTLVNQEFAAARGTMIWDGTSQNQQKLPVGIYLVLLEARGLDSDKIFRERQTVVIGK